MVKDYLNASKFYFGLQNTPYFDRMLPMQKTKNTEDLVEKMFTEGVHYGYGKARRHPSVSPYIYTTKNRSDIIDLEKTGEMLSAATDFVKELASQGKTILLVGTKAEAKDAIRDMAVTMNMPFVTERWIGGTISNFGEIKKRINELENYRKDQAEGKLAKYTKKELVVLSKKMERLAKYYGGLINLKKVPDALFIVDSKAEYIAVDEAIDTKVPVIALANSDSNINKVNFPILGNDASTRSIKFFTSSLAKAFKENFKTKKEV